MDSADSEEEIDITPIHRSSVRYKCLKTCWVILSPIIIILGVLLGIAIVVALIGGWITCFVLMFVYPDSWVFFGIVMGTLSIIPGIMVLIVIGIVISYAILFICIGIYSLCYCIVNTIRDGLSKIDEYEQRSHQVENHMENDNDSIELEV